MNNAPSSSSRYPRRSFSSLRIGDPAGLMFGRSTDPVRCGFDLDIGSGRVFPEINFTLPPMSIEDATWQEVREHYREIGEMIARTSRRLQIPGVLVEFELLPPMTERPEWGAELTAILVERLRRAREEDGLHSALRVTPVDIRDATRPPDLRNGHEWKTMMRSFEDCAKAGAHLLSIESVGGKEVHDEALMYGDMAGVIFALGVLAPRDMEFLWTAILGVCEQYGVVPAGDSACGFANTAMQLASQNLLPEVFAAVVRAASVVRSLVAVECGAVGPSKDCAYEGPVLKSIAGIPISMEGKSASCAHLSPIGNIAAAMCDTWSNESVQNVRLLSGNAPEAFLELLAYDCRLFNAALDRGNESALRDLLVTSDENLSPQAIVLSPEATVRIAKAIVAEPDAYHRTVAAAREGLRIVRSGIADGRLTPGKSELSWMDRMDAAVDALPDKEETLIASMADTYGSLFSPASYGL